MGFEIDTNLDWTDHYIEHGFCVIKQAVTRDFCDRGIAAFQQALGTDLPPNQWTTESITARHGGGRAFLNDPSLQAFLDTVYDQPGIVSMLATMFGGLDQWSGERKGQPFLCMFDPGNPRELSKQGHVDFVEVRIPIIGNGFVFQTSLINTEPFSGNITIYPGLHKIVQKKLLDDPDFWFGNREPYRSAWNELVPDIEPFEFVAEAGDVLLMHHLVGHAGNCNAAAGHTPRVAIHAQAIGKRWPNTIDPSDDALTPWERSLAHNGPISLDYDEQEVQAAAYRERAARNDRPREVRY